MVVLVEIAGTNEQYLSSGETLKDILDGYNKYSQATSIYDAFNTNLPDGFLENDLDTLLAGLALESETPEGASYTEASSVFSDTKEESNSEDRVPRAGDESTLGVIKAADMMAGFKPLPTKIISGVLKDIFIGASEEQTTLANDIDAAGTSGRTLTEVMDQAANLNVSNEKYDSGVKTLLSGAAMGFLSGGFVGAATGAMNSTITAATSSAAKSLISEAEQKNQDQAVENYKEGEGKEALEAFNENLETKGISFPDFDAGGNTLSDFSYSSTSDAAQAAKEVKEAVAKAVSEKKEEKKASYAAAEEDVDYVNSDDYGYNQSDESEESDVSFGGYDSDSGSGYSEVSDDDDTFSW